MAQHARLSVLEGSGDTVRCQTSLVAELSAAHGQDHARADIVAKRTQPEESVCRLCRIPQQKRGGVALTNGVMAHADETDDSHNPSRSHPGCAIVPAALASAEEFGIDGTRFLRAVTLGYDIGTRVVLAMGGAEFSYEGSLATHSIAGTFGAAAGGRAAPPVWMHARYAGRSITPLSSPRVS